MPYVSRGSDTKVNGAFALLQPGYAEEFLADNHPDMVRFLNPVPRSVTPRQARQALTRAGKRAAAEAAVSASSQDLKDWWEFSEAIERYHPLVLTMAAQLGWSDSDLDQLFALAASL